MKTIAIAFFVIISNITLSQFEGYSYKFDIFLESTESFVKLDPNQWYDSINLNQKSFDQHQSFLIPLAHKGNKSQTSFDKECATISQQVDEFMKNCTSIPSIIEEYGETHFNLLVCSAKEIDKDNIRHISGFYYSLAIEVDSDGSHLVLNILFPRYDLDL
jgi:hypothetical protein